MSYPITVRQGALLEALDDELARAQELHPPMRSVHEGHSVIWEEFAEFQDAVRADDTQQARREVMQLAAMCLRFLVEVRPDMGVPVQHTKSAEERARIEENR